MTNPVVTHRRVTGAAADLGALVDGPAWDDTHVVTGLENVPNVDTTNASNLASGTVAIGRGGTGQNTGFLQAGSNPSERTWQNKARDNFSVSDFATATAAATAVTSVSSGGTITVPNGASATLPASYPDVMFDYLGPNALMNTFAETGGTTDKANRLFRTQMSGSHSGFTHSALGIESRPVGSGANGPSNADFALQISHVKKGWNQVPASSTASFGEMDGLNIIVRQGGPTKSGALQSDCAGILMGIQNVETTGFACGLEFDVSTLATNLLSTSRGIHVTQAAIDGVAGGQAYGHLISATAGTIDSAMTMRCDVGASFTNYIVCSNSVGATMFSVDGTGIVTAATINAANLGLTNPLAVAYGGTGNAGGAWTAYTATATPAAGAITTQSSTSAYEQIGKKVFISIGSLIVTVGTGTGAVTMNVPVAPKRVTVLVGRELGAGKTIVFTIGAGATTGTLLNYDNTNVALANGSNYVFSGSYEAQ